MSAGAANQLAIADIDSEPAIYKVETVPPPAGEDDAYSAPTKVGPLAQSLIKKMMEEDAETPTSGVVLRSDIVPAGTAAAAQSSSSYFVQSGGIEEFSREDVPRVYDDELDDANPTLLSPNAKPPVIDSIAPANVAFPTASLLPPMLTRATGPSWDMLTGRPVSSAYAAIVVAICSACASAVLFSLVRWMIFR